MQTGDILIRPASADDFDVLCDLVRQLYDYYWPGQADTADKARAATQRLVFGPTGCTTVIAWVGELPGGFATYAVLQPSVTEHGTFFMKDLFVADCTRGRGLGEQIMRYLARLAVELGCRRIDWTAETDNPQAIRFYDRLGAERVAEKTYFRLHGAELERFSSARE
ncbi:GNAT family N-acetyltransferase [Ruegeria sp. 2012CJ41-6]|uniref:GNAT family N-acetyltransferase n=1 Tax=Ruegeria spongiae TaxID=2942209 RepID=A0ABT0Q0I4_9RHOB|nr:GNAT family N-acetyltransferase [Ruegeria spongiae]MCL6283391.1 GNAT family N-acetyltransferase [Ruegeria spongiae]